MSKSTGRYLPVKFLTNQLVLFHHVNTYEDDDQLVVDVFSYRDASVIDMFLFDNLRKVSKGSSLSPLCYPEFQRFVLPLELQVNTTFRNADVTENRVGYVFLTPKLWLREPYTEAIHVNSLGH